MHHESPPTKEECNGQRQVALPLIQQTTRLIQLWQMGATLPVSLRVMEGIRFSHKRKTQRASDLTDITPRKKHVSANLGNDGLR